MASRFIVPFSTGRSLMASDPLLDLHREMNRLFDDVFRGGGSAGAGAGGGGSMPSAFGPRLDMHESEGEVCISADLPGVTPADIDLQIDGDMVTISGERKGENEHKEQNYHLMERSRGRFQRRVQLPFMPDPSQVKANFDHGVLTIHVPKQAEQQRSRRIEVQSGGAASSVQPVSAAAAPQTRGPQDGAGLRSGSTQGQGPGSGGDVG